MGPERATTATARDQYQFSKFHVSNREIVPRARVASLFRTLPFFIQLFFSLSPSLSLRLGTTRRFALVPSQSRLPGSNLPNLKIRLAPIQICIPNKIVRQAEKKIDSIPEKKRKKILKNIKFGLFAMLRQAHQEFLSRSKTSHAKRAHRTRNS